MTTTAADLRADGRARVREQLRDLALDVARATVLDRGWGAVRMGAVAAAVGTSRQTLHGEFGTKDDLGRALVERETGAFFAAVADRLEADPAEAPDAAVGAAAALALTMAHDNPLLQAVLGGADGDHGLLPLLTTRGEPLLSAGVELFGAWVRRRAPDLGPRLSGVLVESVVRLLVSHAVAPTGDVAAAADDLALLVRRLLR
ncbi:TetR family transcriptional regulator [Nocardioides lentus]|uniref:TetR family transcriptional regulator n=1 Tax=Nocardioides lentus TaxID=338077 RepID=A0ABN2PI64_9ACTN